MEWSEWERTPWHVQAAYLEGLMREELYNPNDYEIGGGDDDLDDLAASGFQVGVEHQ